MIRSKKTISTLFLAILLLSITNKGIINVNTTGHIITGIYASLIDPGPGKI
jgi:hypothetical protein